jgi:hypothetical protein
MACFDENGTTEIPIIKLKHAVHQTAKFVLFH